MKVYTEINALPDFHNAVVTIGTFDGVHSGHRQIIDRLKTEAEAIQGETVIITFHPHPRKIVGSGNTEVQLITTTPEKIQLLNDLNIDHLAIVPFTEAFANQTADEYIKDFLIRHFHPHTLIIGYDHRFGKGRIGDFHLLEKYASEYKFRLMEIPQHLLRESSISSTRIRNALMKGNISEANELLGYSYFFEGEVIEGNKLGRTIGFPTANLGITDPDKLIPGNGVYAVTVHKLLGDVQQPVLKGMMNIGVRPTIGGISRVIEVNLFDFDENIYGKRLKVEIKEFLRHEQKFNGLESLKSQLYDDKLNATRLLASLKTI